MRNPYEVLGVPTNASREQINAAYRNLARQYTEEGSTRLLDELNDAYDQVIMNAPSSTSGTYPNYYINNYSDIRNRIDQGRLEDAQMLLDGIPESQRNAEWNYLKGTICQKKGWLEEAARYFERASQLEPYNQTYTDALNSVNRNRNGGYKTERTGGSSNSGCGNCFDCDACDICTGLMCADCCCECMGGDLIPCC